MGLCGLDVRFDVLDADHQQIVLGGHGSEGLLKVPQIGQVGEGTRGQWAGRRKSREEDRPRSDTRDNGSHEAVLPS